MFRLISSQYHFIKNVRQLSTQISPPKVSQNPVILAAKKNVDQSPWKMNFLVKLVVIDTLFFKFFAKVIISSRFVIDGSLML